MGHSSVRAKVRRRKVASLAAMSRQFSVRNCTVPKKFSDKKIYQVPWNTITNKLSRFNVGPNMAGAYMVIDDKPDKYGLTYHQLTCSWKHEKYPQCKSLHKRIHGQKWIKYKDGTVELKKWDHPSEYPNPQDYQKKLWKNLGEAAKMELYTQDKLKKWEKKHPKPCPSDDLFKDEFIPAWEKEREEALIRIRDFVVSMFDKLPLTGRFKTGEHKYDEEQIAEIKDINGDGHRINDLDTESKLLKKAQDTVNKVHAKRKNLVAGNLRDHKRTKGRIILPKAA